MTATSTIVNIGLEVRADATTDGLTRQALTGPISTDLISRTDTTATSTIDTCELMVRWTF